MRKVFFLILPALILLTAGQLKAQEATYVYAGPTMIGNGLPNNSATLSLTFSPPLPPNLQLGPSVIPSSFTFTDRALSVVMTGSGVNRNWNFEFGTDANGHITQWNVSVIGGYDFESFQSSTSSNPDRIRNIFGSATASAVGIWTSTSPIQLWSLVSVASDGSTTPQPSPNADFVTDGAAFGGTTPCSIQTSCQQPLEFDFDTTQVGNLSDPTIQLAHLSDETALEGDDASDNDSGPVGQFEFSTVCRATGPMTMVIGTADSDTLSGTFDGSNNTLCNFSAGLLPLWATFTGSMGSFQPQSFMLTQIPVSNYQGATYNKGSFQTDDPTGKPTGPAVSATIILNMNEDFTYSTGTTVQFGSTGVCGNTSSPSENPQTVWKTTDQAAITMGFAPDAGVSSVQIGSVVTLVVGDGQGAVMSLIGSTTDVNGNQLPQGKLFFTYFVIQGDDAYPCTGTFANDALFQRAGDQTFPRRPIAPIPPRRRILTKWDRHIAELKQEHATHVRFDRTIDVIARWKFVQF